MISLLIPDIPVDVTIGLDQYSFNVSKGQIFNGIINIPNGIHIVHFQNGGIRYGYWLHHNDKYNYYLQYDDMNEIFEMKIENDVIKYDNILNKYKQRNTLAEYPTIQEVEQWSSLVSCIEWEQIVKFVENNEYFIYIDSSMTTKEENDILNKTLGVNNSEKCENCLEYTPLKFKSRDAIRQGHEMEDFHDKSYYFNDIIVEKYYHGNIKLYYSELQFSYMNSVIFGNYGSSLQWHSMIEVICFAKKIRNDSDFMTSIDKLLYQQLKFLPEEYTELLLNEDMWKRCLFDSFQGSNLVDTRKIVAEKLPHIFEIVKGRGSESKVPNVANGNENNDIEYSEGEDSMLPSIDSDDEDDEGPVIVESLTYR